MTSFVTEWANDGFAVEVDRNKAAIAALPSLKAAFAPESSTTFYRAKLAVWPLPAPLPPVDTLLGSAGAGEGAPVHSRPSFTISLRYKSSKYARQGEAVFRDTILAFVREMPGFVECWYVGRARGDNPIRNLSHVTRISSRYELEPSTSSARLAALWETSRDMFMYGEVANRELLPLFAPLSVSGSLSVYEGRLYSPHIPPPPPKSSNDEESSVESY